MRISLSTLATGLIVGTVACSIAPEPVTPGPERAPVTLETADIRDIAQILRLEDQRQWEPAVFERLADGSEEVRRRTAMAAGRIGDPAAATFLARMLDDDRSAAVRADAAFALGELGDTSRVVMASLREAVPPGWIPVRAAETTIVVEVIQALGKLGTDEARSRVVDALRSANLINSEHARRVAAEALLSIWRFREGPGRVNAVVRYADSDDTALRWRAAYALMRLGEADGVPTLLELMADDDHRARANAARGLQAALADSAGLRSETLAGLTPALRDKHPHVRINAVRAIAGYGDQAPAESMARLLADEDPHVAQAAAEALGAFPERVGDALADAMNDMGNPFAVRAAAAQSLAETDSEAVYRAVRQWADGALTARYAAARTLVALDWERSAETVRTLAADSDPRVAVAALVSAGGMIGDSTAPAARGEAIRTLLMGYTSTDNARLATVAVGALSALVDSTELAALRERVGPETAPVSVPALEDRDPAFYQDIVRTYVVPGLAGNRPRAEIRTAGGEIVVELAAEEAPLTVHNFITLARAGYWDAGVWHRVVPNFVLQDGAPAGDPNGGPGWSIRDEINRVRYTRGVIGMALSGPDTGGSQWFITHSPQHHLDGGYTIFGTVIDGLDTADRVLQGDPIEAISIPR